MQCYSPFRCPYHEAAHALRFDFCQRFLSFSFCRVPPYPDSEWNGVSIDPGRIASLDETGSKLRRVGLMVVRRYLNRVSAARRRDRGWLCDSGDGRRHWCWC